MAIWDDILSETDKKVLIKSGYGKRRGLGKKPAILAIDLQYNYAGDDVPILQTMENFPTGCGEMAWKAIRNIKRLLTVARKKNVPIVYTKVEVRKGELKYDYFSKKAERKREPYIEGSRGTQFVEETAPQESDIVITKPFFGAFFGTPLINYLYGMRIDTLFLTGGTVSGCVRATAVEAASYHFNTAVIQDCVWDRLQASYKVDLLDMWMKICDVMTLEETLEYLNRLAQA